MTSTDLFAKILLSLLFGAILGLESETRNIEISGEEKALKEEKSKIGGFRTYSLISLLGGLAGIFFAQGQEIYAIILFVSLVSFLLVAYTMNIRFKQAFGLTTEVAIIMTFLLGFLTTSAVINIEVVLVILILLAFFLSQKRGFGLFIKRIQHKEITDVFRFGLVSLVVLPLLPNKDFYLSEILALLNVQLIDAQQFENFSVINPFQIWLIVVIISGISLGGYIASRIFGERLGLFFTSVISGFVSSTSALISFASKSLKNEGANVYAATSVISTAVSFIFVGFLMLISNKTMFDLALPSLVVMLVFGVLSGVFLLFLRSKDSNNSYQVQYEPFSLVPALKFVAVIVVLRLLVQILQAINAESGLILLITAVSGITGIDAPTIALATLTAGGIITPNEAVLTFLMTSFVNLLAKCFYARTMGSRDFFKYVTPAFLLISAVGVLVWLL